MQSRLYKSGIVLQIGVTLIAVGTMTNDLSSVVCLCSEHHTGNVTYWWTFHKPTICGAEDLNLVIAARTWEAWTDITVGFDPPGETL